MYIQIKERIYRRIKMKEISDIRLFSSRELNIDGNSLPHDIKNKKANLAAKRIAMKLREKKFSLGEFDHLYINFTNHSVAEGIALSDKDTKIINEAICAAKEGAHMRVLYKEKKAANTIALIYLRIFDDGKYHPILQVKNPCGDIILEKELNPCSDLGSFGTVQVSSKRVKISPRKSDMYSKRKPIIYEF